MLENTHECNFLPARKCTYYPEAVIFVIFDKTCSSFYNKYKYVKVHSPLLTKILSNAMIKSVDA